MSPEPFDSRAKAPPAKRREKGYGDENAQNNEFWHERVLVPSFRGLRMERLGPWPPFWQGNQLHYMTRAFDVRKPEL